MFLSDPGWFFFYAGLFAGLVAWSEPWLKFSTYLFLRLVYQPTLFKLLTCPACFGFWFGLLGSLALYPKAVLLPDALVIGTLTALVAAGTYRLLNWLLGG